jgi:hypothetical protein
MRPIKLATLKVVCVTSSANTTPEIDRAELVKMAIGAEKLRNSISRTPKTKASARILPI